MKTVAWSKPSLLSSAESSSAESVAIWMARDAPTLAPPAPASEVPAKKEITAYRIETMSWDGIKV
jgi:hypothetical protein